MRLEIVNSQQLENGLDWKRVNISPIGQPEHFIEVRNISPEIQKQMPPEGSKPFTQKSAFEIIRQDLKSLLENGI